MFIEKKIASSIMLTLLLTSMLTLAFNVQPVKAEPAEIIIDTEVGESRFTTYPPRQSPYYWVHVQDHDAFRTRAYGGNFWYTLCGTEGTGEPLYYGQWQASLPYSGLYEVFVWIPNPDPFEYGGRVYTPTQSAVYQIYYKDGMTTRTVNQRLRTGGWYSVGTYTFDTTASVILNDRTGEPYLSTMIAFDAIKFVHVPPPFDFTLGISPSSGSAQQGGSVSATVTVTLTSGSTQTVTLTTSGLPSGTYATFNPSSGYPTFTSTFAISTSTTTPTGTFYITIIGSGGGLTRTATYTLTVPPPLVPDFSISASPASLTIQQGGSGSSTITITSINGFNQPVQLSVSGAPSGVTTTLNPQQVTPPAGGSTTSTLTVSVGATATTGNYTLTVTGTSGALTHSTYISLEVTAAPPPPNQPPDPPSFLFQYELDGPEIPVGGTISGDAVSLVGGVSDPDGDRVKLQVELRRLDEYDGGFIGVPTHESEFVDSGYGVVINITGLILGSYHWQAGTMDETGATSEWVSFPEPVYPPNPESAADFTVGPVFRPPYAGGTHGGSHDVIDRLKGSSYISWVRSDTGEGKTQVIVFAQFIGASVASAYFTLYDSWKSGLSGPYNMVASFNIDGIVALADVKFPLVKYAPGKCVSSVLLKASLSVYDRTDGTEVLYAENVIFEDKIEWYEWIVPLPPIPKVVSYRNTHHTIQSLINLQRDHEYTWYFKMEIAAEVSAAGIAGGFVEGNILTELVEVSLKPLEWEAPPEPTPTVENFMYIAVGSPVEVLVTDPEGRRIGFDFASQQEVNEIPGAWYSGRGTYPQLIRILTPVIGNYEVSLVGIGMGNYTLAIIGLGNLTGVYAFTGEIAQNEGRYYSASVSETGCITAAPTLYTFSIVWGEETFIVSVESNSTVSNLYFDQTMKKIGFNVTGEVGTIGFCNVTIPKALLYGEPWTVLIDGASVPATITENATHTCLYFTYTHSTHEVQIIGTWVISPPSTYTLTITTTFGGTTNPPPGTYTYTANASVQVTAIPNADYTFDHWELDTVNVGSANPYTVLMDNNHTLKAVFTYSPPSPPLSASISPLSASILVGHSVTFTSTVSGGYTPYAYQWYLNGAPVSEATSSTWTFTPTAGGIYYVHLKVTDAKGNTAQSETARITAATVPVGGYSFPIQVSTKAEPVLPYIALIAILTAIFTKLRPKTKRKR